MADQQSNAPTSGVTHVRTRLTGNFTIISNRLAQRAGSAVTLGIATYILSLPDGMPVSVAALCAHFSEGEILIARSLRELEAMGYLERRRERVAGGRICTRTFAYDVPRSTGDDAPRPRPTKRTRPAPPARTPADRPGQQAEPQIESSPNPPAQVPTQTPAEPPHPQAVTVLASLRQRDRRLTLSEHEVARLAPAVTEWLDGGLAPHEIADILSAGLPDRITHRPVGLLAYRLSAFRPSPIPNPAETPRLRVLPFQTCDGCERAFRAPTPRLCADCQGDAPRATA